MAALETTLEGPCSSEEDGTMGLHTHSRETEKGEMDISLCMCVFMHAFLHVWEDQSIQEWVDGWRCITYSTELSVSVCMQAGGW